MKFTKCDICLLQISNNNIKKHSDSCKGFYIDKKINYDFKIINNDYICNICGEKYNKKGIYTHIWRSHTEKGKTFNPNIGYTNESRIAWNKGFNKSNSIGIQKYAAKLKGKKGTFTGRNHSVETKKKISEKLSLNNKGGRCKWYKYTQPNGDHVSLQGTWEVRFANILSKIDKDWIKINIGTKGHSFKWIDKNNITHTYSPDFYSPKLTKYFEIKGYWWGNDKEKMERVLEQNNINIEILQKKELEFYENKYIRADSSVG